MKSLLSILPFAAGHQRCPSLTEQEPRINTSGEETERPNSSEGQSVPRIQTTGSDSIVVPKPRKPNTAVWSYWMNYMRMSTAAVSNLPGMRSSSSESNDSGPQSEGTSRMSDENLDSSQGHISRKLTKEERAFKVQKYLDKKKKKTFGKKIRYEYRQHLADRRMRFQGRFVKAEQAKDLIMKGAPITVKDNTELKSLFEEDKTNNLIKQYQENMKLRCYKPIFKTIKDTTMQDKISSSDSNSSGSIEGVISPLLESMKDINPTYEIEKQCSKLNIQPTQLFKL